MDGRSSCFTVAVLANHYACLLQGASYGTGNRSTISCSKKKWAVIIGGAFVLLTCLFSGYKLWTTREGLISIDSLVLKHLVSPVWDPFHPFQPTLGETPVSVTDKSSVVDGRRSCFTAAILADRCACLLQGASYKTRNRSTYQLQQEEMGSHNWWGVCPADLPFQRVQLWTTREGLI